MLASTMPPECLPISKTHDPFKIAGVDMRSEHGRRFRDLAAKVIAEYGDIDPVKVRELAGLKLSIEITQAALIGGDRRAGNDLVRLLNHVVSRAERALREAKRAQPGKSAPLSAYLGNREAAS